MAAGVKLIGGSKLIIKLKKMKTKNKSKLTAGFYKGAKYPDGTSVAFVAYINNFGTEDKGGFIPPRPFFNDAIKENKGKWGTGLGKRLKKNGYDVKEAMNRLGVQMRSDIQMQILKGNYKNNSPITLNGGWIKKTGGKAYYVVGKRNKKGSHQLVPLQDTQQMLRSVGYSVNDEPPQYSQTSD